MPRSIRLQNLGGLVNDIQQGLRPTDDRRPMKATPTEDRRPMTDEGYADRGPMTDDRRNGPKTRPWTLDFRPWT